MLVHAFTPERTMLAVMSYNRGVYLQNCMRSIERHMPGFPTAIVDDNSNQRATKRMLEELSARYRIVNRTSGRMGDRGGLHANMNRALDLATQEGYDFVFFLQDDTQVVRDVDREFIEQVNTIFADDERVAEVGPMFYRGYWPRKTMQSRIGINREKGYYYHIPGGGWGCGLVDIGIISLERINAKEFRFDDSEAESIIRSQSLELYRADCRDPIMMQTPWPKTTSRIFGKNMSLAQTARRILTKLQEHGAQAACNPFVPMSPEAVARLKQRPIDDYPVADDFLETCRPLRKPWWYTACNNLNDFKSLSSFLSFKWYTEGPANYRANVRLKQESDAGNP